MNNTRIAVIGAGHLGRIHCRLIKDHERADLIGVVDPVEAARTRVAEEFGIRPLEEYHSILEEIDAAVIAAPTVLHHRIAIDLLSKGKHVLVEKPIAASAAEASEMVDVAKANDCVLQVGHVERFNPALEAAREHLAEPKYIEASRMSGFTFRSTDIGVVLDLMIHDIDIVLSLVNSPVRSVEAIGVALMSENEDMAQARLTFANGCIANLTASRTSPQPCRSMSVFTPSGYVSLDFANGNANTVSPSEKLRSGEFDIGSLSAEQKDHYKQHLFESLLPQREIFGTPCNAIAEEQDDFIRAIRSGSEVRVSGDDGLAAIKVAEAVLESIRLHRWDGHDLGRIGPQFNPLPLRQAG